MDLIIAGHMTPPEPAQRLAADLSSAVPQRLHPTAGGLSWAVVARRDANVTGVHVSTDRVAVASGSGIVPATGGGDRSAATLSDTTGAGPAPSDRIDLLLSHDWLVARAGPGAHRWYVGRTADGGTLLCNQLRPLAALLDPRRPIDRRHEDVVLGFGFVPGNATVYRGVEVLAPGSWLRLGTGGPDPTGSAVGTGADAVPSEVVDFDSAVDELHRRFMSTVEDQAGAARDVAVLMGGFDSALVAATLTRMGRRVTTYTYGFGDPRYEQRDVACMTRAVAARERWVPITPELIGEGLWTFSDVFCQPGPQPHYQLHTLAGARRVGEDGFDQLMTGDGCDAVFLGYPTVSRRARIMSRMADVPPAALSPLAGIAGLRVAERHLGHVVRMARSTLGANALPSPARGHLPTRYLDDVALGRLRRGPAPEPGVPVDELRQRLAEGLDGLDPVRLAFHGNALTGQSRMKVEGTVTATGVRQYTPFTHPRVRDFVASLPVEYLRPPGSAAGSAGKALLVEMVRRHHLLPPEVLALPKQSPADAPVDQWYQGPLRNEVLALLDHLPFEWDRGYVEDLLRPKLAEELYRHRVAISHNALQAVGLLASYASFHRP